MMNYDVTWFDSDDGCKYTYTVYGATSMIAALEGFVDTHKGQRVVKIEESILQ